MDEPMRQFNKVLSELRDYFFKKDLKRTQEYLAQQAEIRILLASSRNFGHQSSSVRIMRRLIELTGGSNQKKPKFTLWLNDDTGLDKLKTLLPQFKEFNETFQVDGRQMSIHVLTQNLPADTVGFGICGGWDDKGENAEKAPLDKLKVLNYLQLQPYRWNQGDDLLVKCPPDGEQKVIKLEDVKDLYIHNRAFYRPDPKEPNWGAITGNPAQQRSQIVNLILISAGNEKLDVTPVYGIGTDPSQNPEIARPQVRLYNVLAAILFAQKEPSRNKPAVLINLDDKLQGELWERFKRLVQNGKHDDNDKLWQPSERFGYCWEKLDVVNRVTLINTLRDPNGAYNGVKNFLKEMRSNTVLVVNLGGVPPDVFDYLYSQATLPPILEGQATVELMINLGRPYLKFLVEGSGYSFHYPPEIPSQNVSSEKASDAWNMAQSLTEKPSKWTKWNEPPTKLKPLIEASLVKSDQNDLSLYFKTLGDNYHKDEQDKLVVALNYFVNVAGPLTEEVSALKAIPSRQAYLPIVLRDEPEKPLEALYQKLLSTQEEDGHVDLLDAEVVPEDVFGVFHGFFKGVVQNGSALQLTFSEDPTINPDKTVVTVKGTTNAFGMGETGLTVIFTEKDGTFDSSCSAVFTGRELPFPGMPWIGVGEPGVELTLREGGIIPVSGAITATFHAGSYSLPMQLRFPFQQNRWMLLGDLSSGLPSLSELFGMIGGINVTAMLPAAISKGLSDFRLDNFGLEYDVERSRVACFSLNAHAGEGGWTLAPGISIANLRFQVVVLNPGDVATRRTIFGIGGTITLWGGEIEVGALLPDLFVQGALSRGSSIQIGEVIEALGVGTEGLPEGIAATTIDALSFFYDYGAKSYGFNMVLGIHWTVEIGGQSAFEITELGLSVKGAQTGEDGGTGLTGSFTGKLSLFPDDPATKIDLAVFAGYEGEASGWTLRAAATSDVPLSALANKYLGWTIENEYSIAGLSLTITTGNNSSYIFTAKTAKPWEITPLKLSISANVTLGYHNGSPSKGLQDRSSKAEMPVLIMDEASGRLPALTSDKKKSGPYGEISAEITWNNIDLLVSYNFDPDVNCFEVTWNKTITGKIEEKQVDGDLCQIATLKFTESKTLGSMIETMVSWATGSKFSLGAPWNVLDKIPLNNFEIDWNFTKDTVQLKVNIGPIEFGFVTITSIGLCYDKDPDEPSRKRVMVDLDAKFIWGDEIPKWDATKPETTPSANGSGNKYLDLRLLAMGQHVTFGKFKDATTVQDAIKLMAKMPEPKPDEIPEIGFDADSSWLFAADFGILRIDKDKKGGNGDSKALMLAAEGKPQYVLTLQAVFNDPNLYALRIALEGDAAKIFKGLDFQIMYRKISDSIGVYSSEITLPDAMRYLTIGAYSLTLPAFGIEIYTTGDFKVDLGFPWNEDFSRSFTIEAIVPPGIPLIGSGGIYFGKIPQVAANNLPAATNGHFNPILVLGFGAQLGLGKSIEYGLLKAGFSLTMFGILEGLLAKWNPYNGTGTGSSDSLQIQGQYYFWMQGTFGIIGKIFGSVDFSVIKANVDITIKVYAQITFASYEPIPISVVASVDATASLTIHMGLFKIHLHFSFSVRIKETVTIGALQNPADAPWKLEGASVARGRLAAPLAERLRDHGRSLRALPIRTVTPEWSRLQKPAQPAELKGYMAFALTAAGDKAFSEGQSPDLSKQEICYVASLFIESVPAASKGDNSSALKAAGTKEDTAFEKLAKLVARWAVASIQTTKHTPEEVDNLIVHDDELKALLEWLDDPQDRPIPIPTDAIETFLSDQVQFTVSMPIVEKNEDVKDVDAAFFPMALPLTLERAAYGDVPALSYRLDEYNAIATDFISWLREYFNQLAVQVQEESGKKKNVVRLASTQGDISVGSFLFTDYFVLIMRQMLQALRNGLRDFKKPIEADDSGNHIVTWVTTTGKMDRDTFTLYDLFKGNADHELNAGCTLTLPEVLLALPAFRYTTAGGDTLRSVAAAHGISIRDLADIGENGDITNLFSTSDPNINLVHLTQFQVGELIKEAQRVKALEHLSCMVSRYYFHGLRLPTEKITPKQEGMWVTREGDKLSLPPVAGLFALTGQQIAIPPLGADPLTFSITRPASDSDLPWLQFGGGAQTLSFSIQPSTDNCKHPDSDTIDYCRIQALRNFAAHNPLDTGLQSIGPQCMVANQESVYPLSSSIPCQSGTPMTYPTGGTLEGDRPRLWYLPKAMLTLPRSDAPENDQCPCFDLQAHHYDEATGATSHSSLNHYGWTTAIEFTIKRLPQSARAGAYQSTYEIMGAGGQEAVLLERIVRSIRGNDGGFSQLVLGYRLNSDKDVVLRAETGSTITMGISQVNLSTVTRPPRPERLTRLMAKKDNLLNTPSEFIRLLWEASITRAGGFYLYYHKEGDGGLPDAIFNDTGEAEVTLLVIYASNQHQRLRSYMNSVLIGDPVSMSTHAVVAQTVSSQVRHTVESGDSLNAIATRYYSTVLSLAQRNPGMAFATGKTFTLTNGTYLVQEGINSGGNLAAIAEYFAMEAEDIRKVNPRITDTQWTAGLPLDTAIRLPKTGRKVGTHPGGTTLHSLAAYYGSSPAAIAGENRFVVGLLASDQELAVATGPFMQAGGTPPGVQTIGASRSALHSEQPDDPTSQNFARDYLRYAYTMLGFRVVENQDFIASHVGLPLGPQGKPASDDMDKIRVAKLMTGKAPLEYSRTVPYDKLLGDGHGKSAPITNPYQANGRLLQINYAWNDLYGNRLITRLDQGPTHDMNPKSPILIGYTDTLVGLSQWPGISAHWTVGVDETSIDEFWLTMTIAFDASPFEKTEESDAWKTRALTALVTYELLLNQLNDPNGIGIWFETSLLTKPIRVPDDQIGFKDPIAFSLLNLLTAIRDYLKDCCNWEAKHTPKWLSPPSITLRATVSKEDVNKDQLFKLDFQFAIVRTNGVAEGDFSAMPTVRRIATPVPPITTINVNDTQTNKKSADKPDLDLFAKNIEKTLSVKGKYTLTVATGVDRLEADAGGGEAAVWIVRLGETIDQGISFSVLDQNSPQIFAPRPVSNKLVTREAPVYDYASADDFEIEENKFRGPQQTLMFTDIDLDKWVRQLFTAIDNLLSPEYVSSMLVIDQQRPGYPKFLKSFTDQKKALAKVAKNLMSPVYEKQKPTPLRLASAQEALYQELLVKLSSLYSTRASVSFGARVNAEIPEKEQCSRLYGDVNWTEKSDLASQITLTSPKLDLKTGDDADLTFLVEAPAQVTSGSAGVLPAIPLNLRFEGFAIEHQIAEVPGIEDYKVSSWLMLVRPETAQKLQASLGRFDIPMFVRSFPLSPRMEVQTGKATSPEATELGQLTSWDYGFAYSQDFHYPQDRIHGKVEYNLRDKSSMLTRDFGDAFQALAQFAHAQTKLEELLKKTVPGIYATTSGPTEIDPAAKVLGAFLKMVTDVVVQTGSTNELIFQAPLRRQVGEAALTYRFYIEENEETFTPSKGTDTITAWVVTIVSENATAPANFSDDPYVDIEGYTHQAAPSPFSDPSKGKYAYWYLPEDEDAPQTPLTGDKAQAIAKRTVVLPGMRILQCQDAKSTIFVTRNEELVKGRPSSDAFVYQTPEVSFTNPLHPAITSDQLVDIATLGNGPANKPVKKSLKEHLKALFNELFNPRPDGEATIQVEVLYNFSLNGGISALFVPVSILMQPPLTVSIGKSPTEQQGAASNLEDMISQLAAGINHWLAENNPDTCTASLTLKLSIMSNLTRQPMPLLTLTNLSLSMGDIVK